MQSEHTLASFHGEQSLRKTFAQRNSTLLFSTEGLYIGRSHQIAILAVRRGSLRPSDPSRFSSQTNRRARPSYRPPSAQNRAFLMAGFEVTLNGRFGVTPEGIERQRYELRKHFLLKNHPTGNQSRHGRPNLFLDLVLLGRPGSAPARSPGDAPAVADARASDIACSLRLYDHKSIPPVEPTRPEKHRKLGCVGQAAGRDVALPVERQLFLEE